MVKRSVDLVIFEISKENPAEVGPIKCIQKQYPNTAIVINRDEDRDVIANAFSYGAKDIFRKPYKWALIVERVQALLSLAS